MKNALLLFLATLSMSAFAQTDVSLKMTYNGNPVCKYEVTIKHGDVAIGQGVTDNNGEVTFSQVMLIASNIDVHAHKQGAASDMSFDMKGYVILDENNHADIKLEDLLKEITSGSGMPESMFAGSWGLNALDCH
jgi:hypothetical protein